MSTQEILEYYKKFNPTSTEKTKSNPITKADLEIRKGYGEDVTEPAFEALKKGLLSDSDFGSLVSESHDKRKSQALKIIDDAFQASSMDTLSEESIMESAVIKANTVEHVNELLRTTNLSPNNIASRALNVNKKYWDTKKEDIEILRATFNSLTAQYKADPTIVTEEQIREHNKMKRQLKEMEEAYHRRRALGQDTGE
jgi:hypothetical protein